MSSKKLHPSKLNESKMSTASAFNTTRRNKFDTTLSTITPGFSSLSQEKSIQHKLDISYSKYLQSIAMERLLQMKNKQIDQIIDEQLTYNSEILQNQIDETEFMKSKIKLAAEHKEILSKLLFLQDVLKNRLNDVPDTSEIKLLTQQLQVVCDKLYLEGVRLDNDDNVIEKLNTICGKLLEVSDDMKTGTNEEYFNFIENIRKIEELSKKIQSVRENVMKSQVISNKLVLKAVSMKLLKENNPNESTDIDLEI